MRAAALLTVLPGLLPAGSASAAAPAGKVARFRIETRTIFNPIPRSAVKTECWLPIPFADEHQKIEQLLIQGPYILGQTPLPDHGTISGYLQSGPRGGVPMQVRMAYYLERREDARAPLAEPAAGAPAAGPDDRAVADKWLAPDPTGLTEKDLKSRASRIAAKEKTPLGKARAIYDYVVDGIGLLDRTRDLEGAGRGDLRVTLKAMKGDSLDMAAAFVALCRAAGVPARAVTGWWFPPGVRRASIDTFHGWAEFHLPGTGWVPVDPAEGKRVPARKDHYFGSVDERRLALTIGRGAMLAPPQAGPPLNYFLRPYWECDGRDMPDPSHEVEYEEVDEIPESTIRLDQPPEPPPTGPPPPTSPPPHR